VREQSNPLSGFVCTKRPIKVRILPPSDRFIPPITETHSTTLNNASVCLELCYITVTSWMAVVYPFRINLNSSGL